MAATSLEDSVDFKDVPHHKSADLHCLKDCCPEREPAAMSSSKSSHLIQVRNSDPAQSRIMLYTTRCKYALCLGAVLLVAHGLILCVNMVQQSGLFRKDLPIKSRHIRNIPEDNLGPVSAEGRPKTAQDSDTLFLGASCRTGHVVGLGSICDMGGCLSKLSSTGDHRPSELDPTIKRSHPANFTSVLLPFSGVTRLGGAIQQGWADPVHASMLEHFTRMQWMHGVYGSVGAFGVTHPTVAVVLASHMDPEAGERLVVSDSSSAVSMENIHHMVQQIIPQMAESSNSVYIHVGHSMDFTKDLLRNRNIPQFRVVSLEAGAVVTDLSIALEKAACVLRDGGLIVINGLESSSGSGVEESLRQFFASHGNEAISPLLATRDKLYLCTSNWVDRYVNYMTTQSSFLVSFHIRHMSTSAYGVDSLSYYVLQR